MALSDAACRNAKPAPKLRKLSDGGGLQLWVQPGGARLWRLAYRFGGKQKVLALGAYPAISLADARQAREDAKRQLATGLDPSQEKKRTVQPRDTFRIIAEEYVAKLKREGRAETTLVKVNWLLDFAYSSLGNRPITEIKPIEVLDVLRTVEARGRHETARRLRSTIGSVFRYAVATVRAESDSTILLRGALTQPVVKPRSAVTEPEAVGGLLRAIDHFDGQPSIRVALQLMALLFPRPGELRLAEWKEFDLKVSGPSRHTV